MTTHYTQSPNAPRPASTFPQPQRPAVGGPPRRPAYSTLDINPGYIPDYTRAEEADFDFWDGSARSYEPAPTVTAFLAKARVGLYEYQTLYADPYRMSLLNACFSAMIPITTAAGRRITARFFIQYNREEGTWMTYASDGMYGAWANVALAALLTTINDDQRAKIEGHRN